MTKVAPTVAITGANGFLGSALVQHFAQHGWRVVGLVRDPGQAAPTKHVSFRRYDLETEPDARLLAGVDYLVHAAFIKYDAKHPQALNQNLVGARKLLAVSRACGAAKNVFISSMSAQADALSVYGKQKFALEELFDTPNDMCIRPGLILGRGGIVASIASLMRRWHLVPLVRGGNQPLQVVRIDELCVAIEHALTRKHTRPILTIASPEAYTYRQFYAALAHELRIKVLFVTVPIKLFGIGLELADKVGLNLGITNDNLLGIVRLRSVDTRDDLRQLNVRIDPLETSLRRVFDTPKSGMMEGKSKHGGTAHA